LGFLTSREEKSRLGLFQAHAYVPQGAT